MKFRIGSWMINLRPVMFAKSVQYIYNNCVLGFEIVNLFVVLFERLLFIYVSSQVDSTQKETMH